MGTFPIEMVRPVSRRAALAGAWLTGVAALLGLPPTRPATVSANSRGEPLEGAWRLVVSLVGIPRQSTVLLTFSPGGAVLHDGSQLPFTTGHGTWVKRAEREYDYTWLRMAFDADGNYTGMQQLRAHARVDATGNQLDGAGTIIQYDLDDNPIRRNEVSFEGQPITVDWLS